MMKKVLHIFFFAASLWLAQSCVKELSEVSQQEIWGERQDEMVVRLGFSMNDSAAGLPATKASIVGGLEGFVNPETGKVNLINDIKMLCFTKEGIYLGYRTATMIGDERAFDDGCPWGRELFEGTVPSRTCRIHFVGNVPEDRIPDNGQIGGNENTLIRSSKMSMTTADRNISYWGFHGEDNADDMRAWLSVAETVTEGGETIIVGYHKKEGSIVHMIRDRARVEFGEMTDVYRPDHKIDYKILSVDWIISNGRDHGYIAPYNEHNSNDHFSDYYDPDGNPKMKYDRLTEYTRPDGGRFSAWTSDASTLNGETEMMRIWDEDHGAYDNPLFIFEDNNNQVECPKIILRVRYQKNRLSSDPANQVVKYHTLMMMDSQNAPSKIYRNHKYVLNISGLPWEGLGNMNFKDAVESREYANNRTISIDDKVSDVNDGKFELKIEGETYLIYQDPADKGSAKTVGFLYKAVSPEVSTDGIGTDNFTAEWAKTPNPSFASPLVSVTTYNPVTGEGTLQFTLGNLINDELQGGQIKLSDKNSGLSRFLNIYTISSFNPVPLSGLQLVNTGQSRQVNGVSCPTYRLDVSVPANYPIGLYPIKLRMATTTLNPFSVDIDGVRQVDATFAVSVEGTENGTLLDGESLSGMDFATTDTRAWNYRESGKGWNFWYNYTLFSPPEGAEESSVYSIYFDDTRPLRSAQNRAQSVGLFVKIKHFGDARSVSAE